MDISNKTLALLLVGAMVVSLAGTIVSLNKLGEVSITGMPTSVLGNVSLNVEELLSITTEDNPAISFGTCTPDTDSLLILNSEFTENTSDACDIIAAQIPIFVRNNGNVQADVNVTISNVGTADGGSFLTGSTGSYIEYLVSDEGDDGSFTGGCQAGTTGSFPGTYTRFTASPGNYNVCSNLEDSSGGNVANSVGMHIQIGFPTDVTPGDYDVEFTFTASNP